MITSDMVPRDGPRASRDEWNCAYCGDAKEKRTDVMCKACRMPEPEPDGSLVVEQEPEVRT